MCYNEFGRAGIGILFGLRERPALNGYQNCSAAISVLSTSIKNTSVGMYVIPFS